MKSKEEILDKLQIEIKSLGDLHRERKIGTNTYYKMLVATAAEMARNGGLHQAAAVVQGLPSEYFEKELVSQMNADAEFFAVAVYLAKVFVDSHIVDGASIFSGSQDAVPNCPPASA